MGSCDCPLLLDPGLKSIVGGINFRIVYLDMCFSLLSWFNLGDMSLLLQVCYPGSKFVEFF
jgi:hypothetical protein